MLASWFLLLAPLVAEAGPKPFDTATAVSGTATAVVDYGNQTQRQVRIEQRGVIRIAPPGRLPYLIRRPLVRHPFRGREVAGCLPLAGIAAAGVDGDDNLLLFMRDRRVIGARLERACSPRDFYSGFYIERQPDGRLCTGRDLLLARTGVRCSVVRFRERASPAR